jgi:hypothetical protein
MAALCGGYDLFAPGLFDDNARPPLPSPAELHVAELMAKYGQPERCGPWQRDVIYAHRLGLDDGLCANSPEPE